MHRRLQRLGLVTATLLLSLTSPVQLAISLETRAKLAQVYTNQDRRDEADRLLEVGIQKLKGQFQEALQAFEQALGIYRAISDRHGEGVALIGTGLVYRDRGEYPQALKSFEQALVIFQQLGDRAVEGHILNHFGTVYLYLAQYPEALKFFERGLVIAKAGDDKTVQVTTLSNIGLIYDKLGQYTQALKFYEQALVIAKEKGSKAMEGAIVTNIGGIYRSLEQYPQALQSFEQALAILRESGDKAKEGKILNNIALVYDQQGQYAQALKYHKQALYIRQQVGDKQGEGVTLNNIGAAYNSLNQYADAEKTLMAALDVMESLRPGLTDVDRISFFETQVGTYRLLQEVLIAQNKTNTALEIAERGRARAFVELLAEKFSPNVRVQDVALQKPPIEPPKIQEIQQIAKEQNATLVEYSIVYDAFRNQGKEEWRESGLYIWVVKPTGEVTFKQVDLKSLNTSLEELVQTSRDSIGVRGRSIFEVTKPPAPDQTQRLQQLHKLLIEPIAQFLPTNPSVSEAGRGSVPRVIFIPQDSLFLVPFAALKDDGGQYLIEKYTILTAPAIQVLDLTRKQRQRLEARHVVPLQGQDMLIVGNPTMPSIAPKIGEPPEQLSKLPGAQREADAIASLLNTKAITGNDATKSVIAQQMEKARIIHLATHGLLDDFKGQGVPGAIALAPEGTSELNDGLLTSNEIFDMKLSAELVVLSACDTGRGAITGDGVIGLSRSLISAGVPSVIVSLWSVPDAPTASLMTEFYRQLQQNPDKATALRQAMLATMKQHPDPKNWAAFTLIGEAD